MNEVGRSRTEERSRRLYRTIWRWHFYAGIFCIPFVIWLSVTGAIYLFRPQIELWLDRPYDHLHLSGQRSTPEQIALAAVASVPNASLHYYELPPSTDAAVRVEVGVGQREFRVYVHPVTQAILKIIEEDKRPMVLLAHLHGQLLAGRWGSYLVELAASWAVVLLLTGLYLWWPRQTEKFAGVIWIRFGRGQRIFWRDVHAVTGVWVSMFALFLIVTGLPWADSWGAYLNKIREVTGTAVAHRAWPTGHDSELSDRVAMNDNSLSSMSDMPNMPGMDRSSNAMHQTASAETYAPFNRLIPLAASLHLAAPVQVLPAKTLGDMWTIRSDAQNRILRDAVQANPQTGTITSRQNFNQGLLIDRAVSVGVAAHEGQLFGLLNQLAGLATALGLVVLCLSAVVLWWRRRNVGVLGAPVPLAVPRYPLAVVALIMALAVYLPEMAASLVLLLLIEKVFLSRIPSVSRWLGLVPA